MVFWLLATAVTAIACAALYYAALGRMVNAPAAESATSAHHRLQLREIEADLASGRLSVSEATAAKGELAREILRLEQEQAPAPRRAGGRVLFIASLPAVALVAFGLYALLGSPNLPSQPLAARPEVQAQRMTVNEAIAKIEAQLTKTPDDLRGWTVIGPAYMQLGRFADAAKAFRRVLDLSPATADSETNLAQALILEANGEAGDEALSLLKSAAARDPAHIRSRYYLAGEATRKGDWADAAAQWTALIALGKGDEPWIATARTALETAQAGLEGKTAPVASDPEQAAAIAGMVQGLADRLYAEGGTLEEWTRLVRSYLVLDQTDAAQKAYDAAKTAYPRLMERAELDALARDGGLK